MNWFRKSLAFAALAAIAFAAAGAKKKDDGDAQPAAAKSEKKKGTKDGKKPGKDTKRTEPAPEKSGPKLSVPVPPGHDARGLVIPYRDQEGNMQMRFTMDIGSRTDVDHMAMKKLLIETFDDAGNGEMTIDLPQSVLDLNTRVISTESGVTIKRADFELSGKSMEFNTETRAGRIAGNVRMLIYNLENETDSPEETPPREK